MKKIHIALAVLAAAALTSCMQEQSFNGHTVGENEVAFILQGGSTRAAEEIASAQNGLKFELETDETGHKLFLEETIQDLNSSSPATKGSPVYTENVGVLYKNKLAVHASGNFGDATYETMDSDLYEGGWRYSHNYLSDPWPEDKGEDVDFYLYMPATMSGVTWDATSPYSDGKFTFSYTSPGTATDQEDIIFAFCSINKTNHQKNLPKGTPVLFQHALTGVKFAISNYSQEDNITIKSITFTGLVGEGTCVIEPNATSNKVTWTLPESPDKTAEYSSGDDFGAPIDFKTKDNGGGTFENNGNFPDSFAAAGNEQNLNDKNASQTFWFIPQAMTSDVKLTIVYTFGSAEEREGVLEFGKVLSSNGNSISWEAGQLRTYTIKVDEVNVMIEDNVTPDGTADNGFKGSYKDGMVITNTGNTKAFIRAAIVGQWVDYQNNPVFGFTDKVNNLYLVESWYEDQFVNESHNHGEFYDLPGYKIPNSENRYSNPLNGWQLCDDGYYYYLTIVEPGQATAKPVFSKYEIGTIPNAEIAGAAIDHKEMHFELEVAVQAISAVKVDGREGSLYNWDDAWENATGKKPVKK